MTPQERELLTRFLVDLNNTPAGLKDAEAAAMIDDALRALGYNAHEVRRALEGVTLSDDESVALRQALQLLRRQ